MARASLFSFAIIVILFSAQVVLSQLSQVSYFPPQESPEPVYGVVPLGGNRVAFVYKETLYTADESVNGTISLGECIKDRRLVLGPTTTARTGNVYYVTEDGQWKYWDPATNSKTQIASSATSAMFSSRYLTYGLVNQYTLYSYNPANKPALTQVLSTGGSPIMLYEEANLVADWSLNSVVPRRAFNLYNADSMGPNIFFSMETSTGVELYRTNRVTYSLVGDINPGPNGSNPRSLCDVPNKGLFFFANPKSSQKSVWLYLTNAPGSLVKIKNFIVDPNKTIPIVSVGNRVLFIITDPAGNRQLYSSDGTAEGTFRLRGTRDLQLVSTGEFGFFTAYVSGYGVELFQSDGTIEGTFKISYETRYGRDGSDPKNLIPVGDKLYFSATTPDGNIQLFKYTPKRIRVIFDPIRGWALGGEHKEWGGAGSCNVTYAKAPSNLPTSDYDIPLSLNNQTVLRLSIQADRFCTQYYASHFDLTGAKEIRFWVKNDGWVVASMEYDAPCTSYGLAYQQTDPCKPQTKVPPMNQWLSFGIRLTDRPAEELARTLAPLVILGEKHATITVAAIIAVY